MAGQKRSRKQRGSSLKKRKKPRATAPSNPCKSSRQTEQKLCCGFLVAVVAPKFGVSQFISMPPDESSRNCGQDFKPNENADLAQGSREMLDAGEISGSCMTHFGNLVGARCSFNDQSDEICILVDGGVSLYSLNEARNESCSTQATPSPALRRRNSDSEETEAATPSSFITDRDPSVSGTSGKRRRISNTSLTSSILPQLQKLANRKSLQVEGRAVKVVRSSSDAVRVAVLLDVSVVLDSSSKCHWKGGSNAFTIFGHLSDDWQRRKALLDSSDALDEKEIWNVADCHVLGCSIHSSPIRPKTSFDLQEIFKGLSARDPREGCLGPGISAAEEDGSSGFYDFPEEILMSIFNRLLPRDLLSVAACCKQTRRLTMSIIPCMNLRLFPHQQAAVLWMLHRETTAAWLPNPLYKCLQTEDGLPLYLDCVSGDVTIERPPEIEDFRGGLFCDEPGLGKTITALSLILKTQGLFAEPPVGVEVCWCEGKSSERLGYYELSSATTGSSQATPRSTSVRTRRYQSPLGNLDTNSTAATSFSQTRRKLEEAYEAAGCLTNVAMETGEATEETEVPETELFWVQCNACTKWRKLVKGCKLPREGAVWFCRMNTDPDYQSCAVSQEAWDSKERIHSLEGFCKTGSEPGSERNITFFRSVLKERVHLLSSETRIALNWLAKLSDGQLKKLAAQGIATPQHLRMTSVSGSVEHYYEEFFEAFGLVSKLDKKKVVRWHYPAALKGFRFDTVALSAALASPVQESSRIYLSKATLIVVPANLVDHWKTQIEKHTRENQLRVCFCVGQKRIPLPHSLAWDYDLVITTFSRLSSDWSNKDNSSLIQVHWFRIMLDEGHTLGASLALTNKLQMAISMNASRRWVLTGTPTPDTPNSQLLHLQPMLRFLHDQVYGSQHKVWDAAIVRPCEAQCEEGRSRLLELLKRCMICARKADLCTIPPCLRRVKLIDFTETHANSYNELVETVRRNILMADWNDPDHVESLLNPKQWKLKSSTLKNVRLSCCVAGQIKLQNTREDIEETMQMLVDDGVQAGSEEFDFITRSLSYGGNCFRCGEWSRLPMLTPCRHLLCLVCVSLDSEKCSLPSCGRAYKMQTPKARPENPNPKWPVPQDLIELQPLYIQDEWHSDWQATSSSKIAYLIEELRGIQNANNELPVESRSLEKVIVFSQFLEHISVIESQLKQARIQHARMYSPMQQAHKTKALKNFGADPDCLVLLMDGSSALGLDLSFVTHVYLMEPIWDRSIEEQVVSRAHRMGATRPVVVETLAMRGTIEEQMLNFLQLSSSSSSSSSSQGRGHHDPAEGWYLSHLAFAGRNHSSVL